MKSNEYLIYNPERAFRDIATAWAIVIETELNVLRCAHSLAKNTLRKTVIQDLPSFLLIGCSLWISVQVLQNIIGTEKSRKVLEEFSGLALIPLNDLLFGEVTKQRNIVSPVSVLGDERLKEKVNEVFDKDFRSMPQELSWHEYITSFLIVDSIINKSGLSMEKFLAKLIEIANSIPRGIHDFKSFKH